MSGLRGIKTVRDFDLKEKVVFLRLDLNVPIHDGKITDDNRIVQSLPTIKYCLEKGATLVMASHLGRPKSKNDKEFSLEPVAQRLIELLNVEVLLVEDPSEDSAKPLLSGLKRNQVILLENLRFHEGETKNSEEFAKDLASFCEIYINDAFGASHRAHASIDALPRLVKDKGIGFLIEKEIQMMDQLMASSAKPYYAVLGGAKISDKIAVIEKFIDIVDGFVIGGAMAYTFLKAQNISVGNSLVETDRLSYARDMVGRIEARGKKLLLPIDHVVAKSIKDKEGRTTTSSAIDEGWLGVDIGPQTIELFGKTLAQAKTIFWNGPMGIFETPAFAKGTFAVAQSVAESSGFKVVGGGDSASAAEESGYADKMTHISTGGGASLEYLQGDKLPGLEVLRTKIR